MGSTVFRILQTLQNPQASPSGFYISVFSILNPVDPLASVSNLYLDTEAKGSTGFRMLKILI